MKKFVRFYWKWLAGSVMLLFLGTATAQINQQPVTFQNYRPINPCTLPNAITVWNGADGAAGTYQCLTDGKWHFVGALNQVATAPAGTCTSTQQAQLLTTTGVIYTCQSATWAALPTGVIPLASTTTPLIDGTASYGSGTTWARSDHVHPTDTSRLAATGPAVSAVLKCQDTSTSSTAYSCTTTPTFVPAAGSMVVLTAINQTNSGAATLTVNGQAGTPSITKRQNATGLAAGDLMGSAAVLLTFDGVYWELPGTGATVAPLDSPAFTTKISTPLTVGPATHSTGSCSVIGVELAQDGYISWCSGTTWAVLASPSA